MSDLRDAARLAARRTLDGSRKVEQKRSDDPFGYDECPAGEYNSGCVPAASKSLWDRLTPAQRRQWALLEPEAAQEAEQEQGVIPGGPGTKGQEVRFSYPSTGGQRK